MHKDNLAVNFKLPEYTKTFRSDAKLDAKEVAKIAGYKTVRGFLKAVASGLFPKHDCESVNSKKSLKNLWSIKLLRKHEISQRGTSEISKGGKQ